MQQDRRGVEYGATVAGVEGGKRGYGVQRPGERSGKARFLWGDPPVPPFSPQRGGRVCCAQGVKGQAIAVISPQRGWRGKKGGLAGSKPASLRHVFRTPPEIGATLGYGPLEPARRAIGREVPNAVHTTRATRCVGGVLYPCTPNFPYSPYRGRVQPKRLTPGGRKWAAVGVSGTLHVEQPTRDA